MDIGNVYKRRSEREKYNPDNVDNRTSFYNSNPDNSEANANKSAFGEPVNNSKQNWNTGKKKTTEKALESAFKKTKVGAVLNAAKKGFDSINEVKKRNEDAQKNAKEKERDSSSKNSKGGFINNKKDAKTPEEKTKQAIKKIVVAKLISMIFFISIPLLIIIFFAVLISTIFKNADSLIYSFINNGEGTYVEEDDTERTNIFLNYPGLYEKIEKMTSKVSEEYKINIDKYLVISTLVAPIDNDIIVPVENGTCGEDKCYLYEGEQYGWEKFLDLWGDQAELLSKMQLKSYIPDESTTNVKCKEELTNEVIATNDLVENKFSFLGIFNPINWFTGFRDDTDSELNARCTVPPFGFSQVPDVYILSNQDGEYDNTVSMDGEIIQEKDDTTGGVYFWNLVNPKGFIYTYFKDYLNIEEGDSDEELYEKNIKRILDIVNYIYDYYEVIRKDCKGYDVIESDFETINVDGEEIDFEDQYVGGVMLAEYGLGNIESKKAFAILARTFALSRVGADGSGTIENSSNDQNYNPNYSKEKYPEIAKAVEETRGIVLIDYKKEKIYQTMYDAFCPTTTVPIGGFYYLMPTQMSLPINPEYYEEVTGNKFEIPDKYLQVPCNNKKTESQSDLLDEFSLDESNLDEFSSDESVLDEFGSDESGLDGVKPGGHGKGASQYGLKYFEGMGYDADALVRLFFKDGVFAMRSGVIEENECTDAKVIELEDGVYAYWKNE